jgi:hypothetical protein
MKRCTFPNCSCNLENNGRHECRRCQARQYSDEMVCAPCGLRWDTNEPDPPCNHGRRVESPSVAPGPVPFVTGLREWLK